MNKAEFLKELHDILAGKLPPEELDDVLSYYEAYFADSEEDEETVAERLGSPASVAEQVLKDRNEPTEEVPAPQPGKQKNRAFLPIIVFCGAVVLALLLYFLLVRPDPSDSVLLPGQTADAVQTPDIQGDWEGEVDPFTKLDISIGLGNVQVEEGDQWHLRLINRGWDSRYDTTQKLKYSQNGDTLSVWSISDNIASGESSPDVRVLVTVPAGTVLEQANLSLGMGNLTWDDCTVKGRLRAECGMGNLSVSAPVEETTLTTGMGNITLDLAGSQEEYTWDLTASSGTIRLNGETTEPYSVSGGEGDHKLSLTSGMGNVSLEFSQIPTAQPASTPTKPSVTPSPNTDITAPDQITDEMILADEVGYSARHWINYSDSSSCEVSWGSLSGVRRLKTLPGTEARTVSLQYSQQTPGEYRVVLILPNETVVDLKEGENTMDLPEGTTWLAVAAAGSEGAFTVEW